MAVQLYIYVNVNFSIEFIPYKNDLKYSRCIFDDENRKKPGKWKYLNNKILSNYPAMYTTPTQQDMWRKQSDFKHNLKHSPLPVQYQTPVPS